MPNNPQNIIIHCSDSSFGDAAEIRRWHVDGNGWDDIGYHCVLLNGFRMKRQQYNELDDGLIEIGRDPHMIGAHCREGGMNLKSLGICMIGQDEFTTKQFEALERLVKVWRELYKIPNENIYGHKDFNKAKTCPNFEVKDWVESAKLLNVGWIVG